MNNKFILSIILTISLVIIFFTTAYADFGGGSHSGTFGTSGFGGINTDVRLSWDALSELCIGVNTDIKDGKFTSAPINGNTNLSATIYYDSTGNGSGDVYVIRTRVGTTYYTFHTPSGGIYYCYADDAPVSIFTTVAHISSVCDNIYTKVNTITTNISQQVNVLEAIYRAILRDNNIYVGWTTDGSGNNYDTISISRSAADAMIANINTNLIGKKATFVDANNNETVVVISYAYIANNGTIRVYCYNSTYSSIDNYTLITKGHPYYVVQSGGNSQTFDDTDLLNAIDELNLDITNSIGDLGVTVNQSISQNLKLDNPKIYGASSSAGSFNISNSTMDAMITILNSQMLGKPINYVTTNSTTEYYLRGAYKSNNKIRVTMEDSNGSAFSTTAYLCNKYRYTYTLDNTSNTVESTILNIPTHIDALGLYLQELGIKLDNIYNWLDNADLVTNQDLEDMIQEFSSDIDNAESNVKNGAKLFKATFGYTDDGYSLGDILSCINTMHDFWGVPD